MTIAPGIDQGISLYGFNQRFVERREYAVDDMLDEVRSLGVTKFEIVGSIVFDEYPRPRRKQIDSIVAAADARGLRAFSYGGYIDYGRVTGHEPVDQDYIVDLVADLEAARDLGCSFVRETNIPNHLLPRAAELAERYGIGIGIEVHAPSKPSDRNIQEQLAAISELGSDLIGFIPDFGCFIEAPSDPQLARYREQGISQDVVEFIIANRNSGLSEEQMQDRVAAMGGGDAARFAVSDMYGWMSFGPADIDGFTTLLPHTLYFHSKFYHVNESIQDPTIPIESLLGRVMASGFSGVLMSEYEGHAFHNDDAHEQIERHLELERRILTRGSVDAR